MAQLYPLAERNLFDEHRWHRLTGDRAAERVVAICDSLETEVGAPNRQRWFSARSKYEGRPVSEDVGRSTTGLWTSDDMYNLSASAADTAQAEIASRQRPKPMFLTTGAEWKLKRKAKKLDKFVEAQMHQRQSARYSDVWEVAEDVFLDAENAVGGVIKVSIDKERGRVEYSRVPAYELLIDPYEARDGNPRNFFHVYPMDLDLAEATFVDSLEEVADEKATPTADNPHPMRPATDEDREAIRAKLQSSASFDRHSTSAAPGSMTWRATRTVMIREAWFISPSSKKPGRHVFACKDGMLSESDWTWPRAPFAIIVWKKESFGVWGLGLVESSAMQHEHVNHIQRKVAKRFDMNASRRTYFEAGTVDLDAMKANDAEVLVPCKDLSKIPREVDIPPVQPAETQYLETERERYFQDAGISQMSAQQRKEPGVDAAVAMQTLNDIKSVRFMPKARAYELLFVELGEMTVHAAKDLAMATGGKLSARWPGKRFLQEIKWAEVDMDEDMYSVRVAPVSSMSRDPAQRLQIIEQLTNMGFLTREKYFELLGMPDLDGALEMESSESEWINKVCDRYLDADDKKALKEAGGFVEPDGYLLNPMGAMVSVAQHYFDAMVNDAPEYNAELLRRFMRSLKKIIAPAAPANQNAAAPDQGMPIQGAAPGMPPAGQPAAVLPGQAMMAPRAA